MVKIIGISQSFLLKVWLLYICL